MGRFLNIVIFIPLGIVLVALAVANRATVPFTIDPFNPGNPGLTVQLPFFVFLFAALALGLLIGSAVTWVRQGRYRRQARDRGNELRGLREQPAAVPALKKPVA